ncbi:MAG: ANTAR domain-containing protein [Actinomycetota bacterium]
MSSHGYSAELDSSLRVLGELVVSEESLETTAHRIVALVVELIEGVDLGGLSLVRGGGKIETLGMTEELVGTIDAVQYECGEGPCLSSIGEQATFEMSDMTTDTTWPRFSTRAAEMGVRGLLSFVLRVSEDSLGALNLYSRSPNAFTPQDRATGAIFAAQGAISLANALTHDQDLQRTAELERGLATRGVIGRAIGILMERERCSSDEAMAMLTTASQHMNKKLREIAVGIVDETERSHGEDR